MPPATPFDIVRRTPKNNCGECGFPTCLAFAVAAATTGTGLDRCPYIDPAGLDLGKAGAASVEEVSREREQALVEHLKSKICNRDFATLARHIGAEIADNETLVFTYLGQEVLVDKNRLRINGREPDDHRDQILLYNYMAISGNTSPDDSWLGMESMANSISKARTLATYCEAVLARTLQEIRPDTLAAITATLGARPALDTSPDIGFIVPVLPLLPVKVLFWAAVSSENFPARVKVLFNSHALDILDIESLLFAAERMAEHITRISEARETP